MSTAFIFLDQACEIIPQPFRVTLDPDAVSALFAPKASVIARDGTQQSQEEAQPPPKRSSHKAAGGRNPGVRVRYEDPVVGAPPEEVLASLNKVRRNPEYDRLSGDAKALLQVAFRARPVWLRSALGSLLMPAPDGSRTVREVFAGSSSHVFREIVYLSGFTFMDGPWARKFTCSRDAVYIHMVITGACIIYYCRLLGKIWVECAREPRVQMVSSRRSE